MAWVSIQITLPASGNIQLSTLPIQCRQVVVQNNSGNNCYLGDSTVSSSKGLVLLASSVAGSLWSTGPSVAYAQYLSDFFLAGTSGGKIDVFYNT